jgi:alpha-D-ribose 1-methylphosphonate 5-triphosphate diphosphatase
MQELILTNASLVLPGGVHTGTLAARDGRIVDIAGDTARLAAATDLEGDFLLPGLVDLHTDNLERQVQPRPNARWPSRSALLAHDAHCAAAGVTTVLDALCVGDIGFEMERTQTCIEAVADLAALAGTGLLKSEHFLHLRCELPAEDLPELVEPLAEHQLLRLVSLMDHTPGIGQYADLDYFRRIRRAQCRDDAELEALILHLQSRREQLRGPNRAALLQRLAHRTTPLASHDDGTVEEVAENAALGLTISEFPTTLVAARAAAAHGMAIVAGAPNLVRGGSHSGNIAVSQLLQGGLVAALASDYVPAAMLDGVFRAAALGLPLPEAVGLASAAPARLVGLTDRGVLAPGQRADLLRVRLHDGQPVVRAVWRSGERVA